MFKIFLGLLISVAVFGAPNSFDQKFNNLQKGMETSKVKDLIGSPDLREVKGAQEIWHYSENGGRQVIFEGGKVTEFGKDQPATPTPQPHVLNIGDECKADLQCKSDNCHFGLCSGKNNCSVPVGKVCANNDDCCGGWCDFQKCKTR